MLSFTKLLSLCATRVTVQCKATTTNYDFFSSELYGAKSSCDLSLYIYENYKRRRLTHTQQDLTFIVQPRKRWISKITFVGMRYFVYVCVCVCWCVHVSHVFSLHRVQSNVLCLFFFRQRYRGNRTDKFKRLYEISLIYFVLLVATFVCKVFNQHTPKRTMETATVQRTGEKKNNSHTPSRLHKNIA